MVEEFQIRVKPEVAASDGNIIRFISEDKGIDAKTICQMRVLRRSVDARQRNIFVNLRVKA